MPVPLKPTSVLAGKIAEPVTQRAGRREPVWKGPESTDAQGGVTQSLLGRFLSCRERFRLKVVEGLGTEGFNHRLFYGNCWHVCEEWYLKEDHGNLSAFSSGYDGLGTRIAPGTWRRKLDEHCRGEAAKYPFDREKIEHWWAVCCTQFPIYIDFWSRHTDPTRRTPLLQEQTFRVPYRLPSGRTVQLRGKWDGADLVDGGIVLREHKTKGELDPGQIARQLSFDLQTMFYLVALTEWQQLDDYGDPIRTGEMTDAPIRGVLYNCIRRPLSGGKGSIVQRKGSKNVPAETREEYYARLGAYMLAEPETYFMRFQCDVSPQDIAAFRQQCLDPVLGQLCDWWSWISKCNGEPFSQDDGCENSINQSVRSSTHFRYPFGVWNPLSEGKPTEMDHFISTGSDAGLTRTDNLFPELT